MKKLILYLLFIFALLPMQNIFAQKTITALSTAVTENFNTLTSGTWSNNTTVTGWYARTDATASITSYSANTGATTTAGLYAFGVTGTNALTDRALGFAPSNAYTGGTGTGKGYIGWRLKNNTGATITSLTITWTGEQYRKENNAAAQTVKLFYQTGATVTDLLTGTWTDASSLFTSPITGATTATVIDGNAPANRTVDISKTITVNIAQGEEIMLRWEDLNDSGLDHLMAIDDISVTATGVAASSIILDPITLSGFSYSEGNGPSTSQSFNMSGTSLSPASGNLTVTGSTHFEVSTDNTNFSGSINVPYLGGALAVTPIYVRLKAGLSAGVYSNDSIKCEGGGATVQYLVANGTVISNEPTNHVTLFNSALGTLAYSSLTVSWTDASAGTLPDGYVVVAGTTDFASLPVPVDGTPLTNKLLTRVVAQGVQSAVFTELNPNTTYYFKIYPYKGSLSSINYKTDGTVPQHSSITDPNPAHLLTEHNFDYSGTLTDYGWVAHSSAGQSPMVTAAGLTYTGYPSSNIGNATTILNAGEDISKIFTSVNSGTVYYSAIVKVNTAFASSYFMHLAADATTYGARLFVKPSINSGKINFGISNSSTAVFAATPTDFDEGAVYLLVVKYEFTTGNLSLWINSTGVPASEVIAGVPEITTTGGAIASVDRICLRQNIAGQSITVDGIRVANDWIQAPMPVELTSFNAKAQNNKVVLSFATSNEVNNYGFDVERKSENNSWTKIGFVQGSGNSNSGKYYSYTDTKISGNGKYAYRLKQIDIDGSYTYSNEVEVNVSSIPNEFTVNQNYPNPFNPSTSISFTIPNDGLVNVKVFNVIGQEVATLVNENLTQGLHTIQFNAKNMNSGIYYYKVKFNSTKGNFELTKKMTLIK